MAASSVGVRAGAPGDSPRYERRRVVGAGAFGVVHEAVDRVSGRVVAMKELVRLDPAALRRFKLEFRAFADLDHPHIVRVHALVSEDERWFVVMDFIDGVDLMTALRGVTSPARSPETLVSVDEAGPAPATSPEVRLTAVLGAPMGSGAEVDEPRLRRLFRELASAVAALHAAGRLHRDIKPSNVLVDRTDRVVLVDFGLSTELALPRAAPGGSQLRLAGTPAYMSPEQSARARLGPASDWYGFGVVLYQALTGVLPFEWGERAPLPEVRAALAARDPRELWPACPADLATLVLALLSVDPAARPSGSDVLAHFAGSGPVATPEVVAPFVGRAAALASLDEALARSRTGPLHVRVEAPSGVGKSALIAQLEARIAGQAVVLRGRAFERESIPFKSVDPLVDALAALLMTLPPGEIAALRPAHAAALARMFPVLGGVFGGAEAASDPHESKRRAFEAFGELVGRLSRAPLVIVLDDAHWGDADGARLLGAALTAPVLLITTCRSQELDAPFYQALGEAAPEVPLERLELDPLSHDEALAMAATLVGGDAGLGERVAAESGGHPFFLLELARRAGRADEGVVVSLEAVLSERVRRLAPEARRALSAIAFASRPVALGTLAAVVAMSPGQLEDALRTLFAERVVRRRIDASEVGHVGVERVECAHDRVRETAVRDVPAEDGGALHRRLAGAFEAHEPAEIEAIAMHWLAGGEPARAAPYFVQAGEQAMALLAFEHAAELFASALAGDPSSLAVHEARAEALALAGRDRDSARAFEGALAVAEPARRPGLERRRAEAWLRAGHLEEGLLALRPMLRQAGVRLPRTTFGAVVALVVEDTRLRLRGDATRLVPEAEVPPALLARIDANWAACQGLANVDIVRGLGFLVRHLRLALAAGERRRLVRGLGMAAMFLAGLGKKSLRRAERYADMATRLATDGDDPGAVEGRVWAGVGRAMIAFARLDWVLAQRELEAALATIVAHGRGFAWELGVVQYFVSLVRHTRGDVGGVLTDIPRWSADAERRGDRYTRTMLATTFTPWCELCKDRPARAREGMREAILRWPGERFMLPHLNAIGMEAESLLYEGRAVEAYALLMRSLPRMKRARLLSIEVLALRVHDLVVRAGAHASLGEAGDPRAARTARKSLARLRARGHPWTDGLAFGASAVLEGMDPIAALTSAEAAFREAGAGLLADLAALRRLERTDASAARTLRDTLVARGIEAPERMARQHFP